MNGCDAVKELIEDELSNYGFFELKEIIKTEDYDGSEYFTAEIYRGHDKDKIKYLHFKFDLREEEIYIDMSEDCWEEINDYSTSIKYFWMALLEW
jgi:hypothetical protein